jgi:hypothetical protein
MENVHQTDAAVWPTNGSSELQSLVSLNVRQKGQNYVTAKHYNMANGLWSAVMSK